MKTIENKWWSNLIAQCRDSGVLFDTELLLLICVGLYDKLKIAKFKKVNKYDIEDYDALMKVLSNTNKIFVSPQILAELSNHLDMIHEENVYYSSMELLKQELEIYIEKDILIQEEYFPKIGFTDMSLMKICEKKNCVLFTADFRLSKICQHRGFQVVNYNEIRGMRWF